jgi:small subunit ribosomal protein S1
MRKIKGGLLVDIGVPVFLPASQVDIRRPGDIGEFIGKEIRADPQDRHRAPQHRHLAPQAHREERAEAKKKLLEHLEEGQVVKGTVKNIADFGAFVDLGGIDGLLHITDMSWGRINHPSEMRQDRREDRGQGPQHRPRQGEDRAGPQAEGSPPPGRDRGALPGRQRVKGEVVNLMSYGAFVRSRTASRAWSTSPRCPGPAHQPPLRDGQIGESSTSSSSTSTRTSRKSRSA